MKRLLSRTKQYVLEHRVGVALSIIMLLAVFFRFWRLWDLPPGLYEDEAANGLDIVHRILAGDFRPFYATNNGRESLFFFIQAPFVKLLGPTALALRLPAALISLAVVPATYGWVKEWFSKRTALLAALFVATGSWAVSLGRLGFRAGMVPLVIALFGYFVSKSYKTRKWYWHLLSGLTLGAGFYTYISFRVFPLVLGLAFIYALIWQRKKLVAFLPSILIIGAVTAASLVPLGLYTLNNRSEVLEVRNSVSVTSPNYNQGSTLKALVKSSAQTALMFNFSGDQNPRHNLSGAPMLNALVGVMFIFGLLLSLRRVRDIRYFSLLALFGVMLLPVVLTAEGIPHMLRAVGVVPVVYVLAAVGLVELLARWKGVFPRNPAAYTPILALLAGVLAVAVTYDYQRYFVAWANAPETYQSFSLPASEAAKYINQNAQNSYLVLIDVNQNRSLEYLTYQKGQYQRVEPSQLASLNTLENPYIIVVGSEPLSPRLLPPNVEADIIATGIAAELPNQVMYRVYQLKTIGQ